MLNKQIRKFLSLALVLCLVLGMTSMEAFAVSEIPMRDSLNIVTPSNATPNDVVTATFNEMPEENLYQDYDYGEAATPSSATAIGVMPLTGTTHLFIDTFYEATTDQSGPGWTWTAEDNTFTLSGDIAYDIFFLGIGDVSLVVSGTPTVTGEISSDGRLTISGGTGDVLTVNNISYVALAAGSIEISGATVNAATTANGYAAVETYGDFTMSSGTLNLTSSGSNGMGLNATSGGSIIINGTAAIRTTAPTDGMAIRSDADIIIDGSAKVDVASTGNTGIRAWNTITVSGGTVMSKGIVNNGALSGGMSGVSITGGSVTTGDMGGSNGDVYCDLSVSGTGADVTVNGSIGSYGYGNLTVSAGTVTVTGTVGGTTTHTGGTLNGSAPGVGTGPEIVTYTGSEPLQIVMDGFGIYYLHSVAPSASASTSGNQVAVSGTSPTVPDFVFGGYSNTAVDSTGNTVTFTSNASVTSTIAGSITFGTNATIDNTVTLNQGITVTTLSFYGGFSSASGNSTDNKIIVGANATADGDVYGGYSTTGNVTDNCVVLNTGAVVTGGAYGGFGLGGVLTGNTLELNGSGQYIDGGLSGFQNFTFNLPAGVGNDSMILTVGDDADITGTAVAISLEGASSLDVGNRITLVNASAGTLIGTPANTSVTVSGYTFSLTVESSRLVATVTDAPAGPTEGTNGIYTITFNTNGGSVSSATMQTGTDGKLTSLPIPIRIGNYSFDGWYTAASGGTEIATDHVFTGNTTVYAHWTYTGSNSNSGSGNSSGNSFSGSTGVITTDAKKGKVSTSLGIITGTGSGYSKWKQDGNGWKLQYADNSFAAGNSRTDADGTVYETLAWELINGAWYCFGADGYAKSGFVYDQELNGWLYIDINTGMKTGWQQLDSKWYFFNPTSDGSKGKMAITTRIDGWYVDEHGVWDGMGKQE